MKKMKTTKKMESALISETKLSYWIKNRLNVLFEGDHGVGKTSIILEAWKKAGLKYAYFSGATMDPFIDFVGVPVKVTNSKTGLSSIELIRPKHLAGDVQAIFIDEFNRTHKKVRNAVMELLQFKTINGKPISKDLRIVWAAVNPDNENGENDYDTDRLDPAQRDRFQVQQQIPYLCDLAYFTKKYGEKVARTAIQYWNALHEKVRKQVSPRRLDYALELWTKKGDIRDALPLEANPGQLIQLLGHKGTSLDGLLKKPGEWEKFWADENNYNLFVGNMVDTPRYHVFFTSLPKEKVVVLLSNKAYRVKFQKAVQALVRKSVTPRKFFNPIFEEILKAGQSGYLATWCKKMLKRYKLPKSKVAVAGTFKVPTGKGCIPSFIRAMTDPNGITHSALAKKFPQWKFTVRRAKMVADWVKKHGGECQIQNPNSGDPVYRVVQK